MKSSLLFLAFTFSCFQIVSAQTFTEKLGTPFTNISSGSIAFSDVDGDGDQDVLLTGKTDSWDSTTELYINDGSGNFTQESSTSFELSRFGSVAFADVDGDGDDDVLISGENNSFNQVSKLYTNDGMGTFTEVTGTSFVGVSFGETAFSDVDGDGDQDVLITGSIDFNERTSKLYINDGAGNFTEKLGISLDELQYGSIAFADVDGDDDQDLLMSGNTYDAVDSVVVRISKLYSNDGIGNFTEVLGTPFTGVEGGSTVFSDVDGDGDQDVLLTGFIGAGNRIAKLYINDGMGNFTEDSNAAFPGVDGSSITFADVDGDGDDDVLITGFANISGGVAKLYDNDGMGNFTEVLGTPFVEVYGSSTAFADVDGDGDQDVLITGDLGGDFLGDPITKLYLNDLIMTSTAEMSTSLTFDFLLYPIPATADRLNIKYQSTGTVTVNVLDMNGRLINHYWDSSVVDEQTIAINISSLNSGAYLIQINDGERIGIKKFIVQ